MLKGTTTIELTDVKTGQVQTIVHDNMVTNAVADMCRASGLLSIPINAAAYRTYNTIAENMFGGLLLWEKSLDVSNVDDYYIPANNTCIGYGCHLSNGTVNDMMGTLNESETGGFEGGYKFVWDFATSQANGAISAVSLVPRIAGQLGLGLKPDKYASSLNMSSMNHFFNTTNEVHYCNPFLFARGDVLYGVSTYNLAYHSSYVSDHISRNGKKLIIKRVAFPVNNLYLMDKQFSYNRMLSDIEVQLPDEFEINATATAYYGFCNYDSGFIYLYVNNKNKDTKLAIKVCKINVEDWSCSLIELNAAFDASTTYFNSFDSGWNSACYTMMKAKVINNRLIIANSPGYYVDFNEPTIMHKFTYEDADETPVNLNYLYAPVGKYLYSINTANVCCMLNTETGKASYLNSVSGNVVGITSHNMSWHNECLYHFPYVGERYLLVIYTNSIGGERRIGSVCPPHVMTTKNNLDAPVLKTSGQTMKVTYVLREITGQDA